uniref:Uncharacterized protein n=1 Tax=Physcomitrium patens TaxID=3218 RepID=A0A2K1KX57_PHYPA|nr:hypothetical protein PHYPA_005369 [Physcomitrium patens]
MACQVSARSRNPCVSSLRCKDSGNFAQRTCDDYYEATHWTTINCTNFNHELWVIHIKERGSMLSTGRHRSVDYLATWSSQS